MRNLPPLPALRAFEAVARLGSVVKAAAELHVTHGAISQQLRVLEECLGFDLFKRGGRRLAVNEDGRIYAMRVRAALSDIAHATTDVLALPRPDELVIALLPSFGAHWLVRRLPSFCAAHPNLKITLRASLDFVDFAIDRVDVAIRMGPGAWEGLSNQPLFDDEHLIAAAPHFNGGRLPRTPAAILRAPLLRSVESWNPWLLAAGLPDTELSGPIFTDSNLLMEAVRQGQGVALTRRSLAHDALRSGELVQLTKIVAPYPESYWLVWPSRSEGTPKLLAFSQWLMGQVRTYQAELAEH